MFRSRPYWGWLTVALLCWGLAWYADDRHQQRLKPGRIAAAVQEDLQAREHSLDLFLNDGPALAQVLNNTIPDALFRRLLQAPFYLYTYQGDTLKYWNDDDLLAPYSPYADTGGSLRQIDNSYCIRKAWRYGDKTLIALLPIAIRYPFENEYLKASLEAVSEAPEGIRLTPQPVPGTFPLKSSAGRYWCAIHIPETEKETVLPDAATLTGTLLAVLFSAVWLQLMILTFARARGRRAGLVLTLLFVGAIRAACYFWPLPFRFNELEAYSPLIYGYSKLLPSLGDLLLSELCLLWLLIYLMAARGAASWVPAQQPGWRRTLLTLLYTGALLLVNAGFWTVIYSLVRESQISFNVSHLHNIDGNTLIGLLGIVLGITVAQLSVRFISLQLRQVLPSFWFRQGLLLLAALLLYGSWLQEPMLVATCTVWLILYTSLLEAGRGVQFKIMPSLPMIFMTLFSCSMVTLSLHRLIRQRDLEKDRVAYAGNVLAQQDLLMEYNFRNIAARLYRDTAIRPFLTAPTPAGRESLAARLQAFYLNDLQGRYQPDVILYDRAGAGLYNTDSISLSTCSSIFDNGRPAEDSNLVFTEDPEASYYLARLVFPEGSLFLRLAPRKTINESVYPELLQPATINRAEQEGRYAYARYVKGRLVTQTSNHVFPDTIRTAFKTLPGKAYKEGADDELIYQETPDQVVVVAGNTGSWLSALVLLSYLFWLYLLLVIAAFLYQGLFRLALRRQGTPYHFTWKRRINLSMQGVVLVSFFIVGLVTIAFFSQRYQKASRDRVQEATATITRFIRQYLAAQDGLRSPAAMDSVTRTATFHAALSGLAANEKADANLFDRNGRLLLATREALYNQGLLAPVMQPGAFRILQQGAPVTQIKELVGRLQFLSSYAALKNEDGTTLGYISVPFFSSERELRDELSNIIVALVNIYALLFLLSSLASLLITSRLTRTFNMITGRFSNLSLQQNELIDWPYEDEIGLLVKEYNNMARKVEANAALLAQNERESAWREMAKQVAHEIKNPLTPMKLNIQYLQNALKSGRPDAAALAERVSASLIEQIDNLTYIASEFSHFAKLPEADAALIRLNTLLENAVALFEKEEHITISYNGPEEAVLVMADKSQLVRAFTNLLQNAVQAVQAAGREGRIDVRLAVQSGAALITVQDNGVGISQETADRIFQPYFTTKSSGTGLGLAMTRKIMELWKGSIWFESAAGAGTTFYVKLPLGEAA